MTLTGNNVLVDLLIAVLIYFLGQAVIDTFITDAPANRIFKIVLLIICVLIAIGGSLFIH